MKKSFLYIITISSVFFFGCKKYLDINQDPNAAAEPPIKGLLANTTNWTAINSYYIADRTSYYSQYLASPSKASSLDTYDEIDMSTAWNSIYDIMTDINDMKKIAEGKGLNAYIGVGNILMAMNLNMASNVWGNMPYAEAFQGVQKLNPKYDYQKALYDSCLDLLDRGIAALQQPDADGELDENSDFIHAGSVGAWIKTAHAFKARMLNQVSKTSSYNTTSILSELGEGYTSNDDDAQISVFDGNLFNGINPWALEARNNAALLLDGWLSAYLVDATNGKTFGVWDPRLPIIASQTKYGTYVGTINGAGPAGGNTDTNESYLPVDMGYSADNAPLRIITFSECKFIEAEAQFKAGKKTEAYDAYMDGIKSNLQKVGVADTAITRYTNEPTVAVGSGNLTLALIMKEKYVACFLNPVTWDDLRRMDYAYKDFALPENAVLPNFIRRVNYPNDELSTNGQNAPTVTNSDHLWWDQ
jgi:hypothetical protein